MMRGLKLGASLLVCAFSACAGDGEKRAEQGEGGEAGEGVSSAGSVNSAGTLATGGASAVAGSTAAIGEGGNGDGGSGGISGSGGSALAGNGGQGEAAAGGAAGAGATSGDAGASGSTTTDCTPPPPLDSCQEPVITGPQEAYLKPAIVDPGADWGRSMALDGDTLVVGGQTYGVDTSAGGAIVFRRDCNGWHQEALLTASNGERNDLFGYSVAISGDTIVVGAPDEDGSAINPAANDLLGSGAAYVFTRCGADWVQQAYLKANDPDDTDHFGKSVAIDGDTIAVGAPEEDSDSDGVDSDATDDSGFQQGAVNVFTRQSDSWTQTAYLKASQSFRAAHFGSAVAVSGTTILVGASGDRSMSTGVNSSDVQDAQGFSAGATYVFVNSGGNWAQQAYLKASNTSPGQEFGLVLALDGDTAVIGAPGETSGVLGNPNDHSASQAGAAYVFARTEGVWTQQAYLKASNTERLDIFASDVDVEGDSIIVGARQESSAASGLDGDQADNSLVGAGAAYVFSRSGMTWTQTSYVKASQPGAGDVFGISVALSGQRWAVAAMFEDSNSAGVNGDQANNLAPNSGAVYVFKP
jgi:FG-GAP repeat